MMDAQAKRETLRAKIHAAMLKNAPFDGWGEAAFARAAKDSGQGLEAAERAFPEGASGVIEYHLRAADQRMLEAMKSGRLRRLKLGEKIAQAVRARLEAAAPHREATRRLLLELARPRHARLAATSLARTSDAIWRAAGDRSTDFSYYTKRASLGAIYAATLLYWLNDDSEGSADSWAFLDRRLAGIRRIAKLRRRAEEGLDALKTGAPFLAKILRRAA